jgi:hypothetical protein
MHDIYHAVTGATLGLNYFLLKPDGIRVEELFDIIIWFAKASSTQCEGTSPSHYLDVERDNNQVAEFGPQVKDFTKQSIMSFASRHGASMNLSKRRLDNLSYIKSFSGKQNDPDRLRCLRNKLELADPLAYIANAESQ